MTEWAAKVLADVPIMIHFGKDGEGIRETELISKADAIAAIAKLGAGDDLVERLLAVDHMDVEDCFTQSPLFSQAAARIAALTAERDIHAKKGQEWAEIAHAATDRGMKIEAENTTLREKVEKLGRDLNVARYGQPDFAWSIHKEEMAALRDLMAELVDARKCVIAATDAYNAKWSEAQKRRQEGDWSLKLDDEFLAMEQAKRDFIRAAERFADGRARAALTDGGKNE